MGRTWQLRAAWRENWAMAHGDACGGANGERGTRSRYGEWPLGSDGVRDADGPLLSMGNHSGLWAQVS